MILLLATRYQRYIAFFLFYVGGLFLNIEAMAARAGLRGVFVHAPVRRHYYSVDAAPKVAPVAPASVAIAPAAPAPATIAPAKKRPAIGGPTQPEMSSFKSVNSKDMVNLFTGSFSYNIPLLDVGGYPVNIYYNGEIGMEQEASWVGLGWNINPGTITRNMRGIPDDFNGQEKLEQQQNVKPNHTFGITLGPDVEWNGLSGGVLDVSAGMSIGVSWNNYLGPALNTGFKGGLSFQMGDRVTSEKGDLKLGAGIAANIGSRSGFSLSPNVSLTANVFDNNRKFSAGATLSTTYNSREGIKALQISEQVSANKTTEKGYIDGCNVKYKDYSSSNAIDVHSSGITFARPSYTPMIRMPMINSNASGNFQLGGALFGVYVSGQGEIFSQTSKIDPSALDQKKPMVGYLFYDKANGQPDMVTDFTRFNDREVTPNTPIISAPQYTYDVFTIQGEGTGGSIRAYRNDLGSVRDNFTGSKDGETGIGADIGVPGHYGLNVNLVKTPTTIGEWTNGNTLKTAMPFDGPASSGSYENVYFRNPSEGTVLDNQAYTRVGGTDLVRFKLMGDGHNPGISTNMDRFLVNGTSNGTINPATSQVSSLRPRQRRTQVVDFLNAADASIVGLDKKIYSYSPTLLGSNNMLTPPTVIPRYDNVLRWDHHISQISVTEDNGKRYVYGLPVYNTKQSEYTFSVANTTLSTPDNTDVWTYISGEDLTGSVDVAPSSSVDGYVEISTTPGYAHSFLLTGLLSPDYVDVTGDGITEDDLGQAVKFNYTQMAGVHKWRTPTTAAGANFNPGNLSNVKDDKGMITYGERESWYLHSIESKNLIAVFTLQDRNDGKGVNGPDGGINGGDVTIKALQQIDLYSKSDLRQHGLAGAKPVKTVHFVYGYDLCPGTPDNPSGGGKLTLESIYFTYNGQARANKDQYIFSYTKKDGTGNPAYAMNASDRWGMYKPTSMNPDGVKNSFFPYTPQDQAGQAQSPKTTLDANAGAWSLKRILLPSGGQLEIGYESKDYAYVQNARAMDMLSVAGFGSASTSTPSNHLYDVTGGGTIVENPYLFINVPKACSTLTDVYTMYLQGVKQIAVKLDVNMPAANERITSYGTIDYSNPNNPAASTGSFGFVTGQNVIWVKLKEVDNVGPLSLSTVEFLKDRLPAQAYPGYDVSESAGLDQVIEVLQGWLSSLTHAFGNPVDWLRSQHKAQTVQLSQCFARLDDPDEVKYGGGQRVSYITLKDNWDKMGKTFLSSYTQIYDYTTTETFEGGTRKISSGVASYEPGIGGDENPFQTIVQVEDKLPMGPANYGAVEMPVLEPFFPAPTVGYSQVTVRSASSIPVPQGSPQGTISRSLTGRQVTQFYTAKDFPVYYSNTGLDPSTDYEAHESSTTNFFYKFAFDARALSQGFLVATNDMHGKIRSEASYPDGMDSTQLVSYKEYFYRNTGVNGLNETFPFVASKQGGVITQGNMGIDIELMTDTREFIVKSNGLEVQGQVDLYPVLLPIWLPFIWPVTANSENDYRAVTTTKVVSYHGVLDSIVAIDKGSKVSTKNLLYDGETGQVIATRTINEFNEPLYSTAYPAWWAYDGMGPAYQNTDLQFVTPINFTNGLLVSGSIDVSKLVSGDELLITSQNPGAPSCSPASQEKQVWVMDLNKNNAPSFPAATPNFIFIDKYGNPYNNTNVTAIRVIRSGRRNMLDAKVATITSMMNPIVTNGSVQQLSMDANSMALNATAVEYSEKWQTDQDEIGKYIKTYDENSCTSSLALACNGTILEQTINPYRKGLLGTYRPSRTLVFYGDRNNKVTTQAVKLSSDGYLPNFGLYWNFNGGGLAPNASSTLWVESDRINRMNAQGLQLETRNAVGIYTAAQYGFNKTLPLAITDNSPVSHAAYAGFEDYGFNQGIDGWQPYSCSTEPIDFTQIGTVTSAAAVGFHAHTGQNMLSQAQGSAGTIQLPIVSSDVTSYNLTFGSATPQSLINTGVNYFFTPATGGPGYYSSSATAASGKTVVTNMDAWQSTHTGFTFNWDGYIVIGTKGTYHFPMSCSSNYNLGNDGLGAMNLGIFVTLTDISNPSNSFNLPMTSFSIIGNQNGNPSPPPQYASTNNSLVLCPGIYHVAASGSADYGANVADYSHDAWFWSCTECTLPIYINTQTQGGCTTTTGIAGDPSMLNPSFSMPAGVPMVLSAWVHETPHPLANGADTASGWYNDKISMSGIVETNNIFYPTGPMIDGWQRYEAKFTPAAFGNVTINFFNNTTNPIYWDDIRVQPFNSQMKSYVYDPVSMRLVAELDANNYATFYEYDEEGTPVRTKAETQRGIQTIKETRSAKQKNLTTVQ
jgi:hypothetical protein